MQAELGGVDASLVFAARVAGFRLGFDLLGPHGLFVGVGLPPTERRQPRVQPVRAVPEGPDDHLLGGRHRAGHARAGRLAAAGKVKSHVSRTGALSELGDIFDELEASKYLGRAVLTDLGELPAGHSSPDLQLGVVLEQEVVGEVVDELRSARARRARRGSSRPSCTTWRSYCESAKRATRSPVTWKVRPLTSRAASVQSHTTIGEIFAGGCVSGVAAANCDACPPRGRIVIAMSVGPLRGAPRCTPRSSVPSASGRIALQRTPNRPSSRRDGAGEADDAFLGGRVGHRRRVTEPGARAGVHDRARALTAEVRRGLADEREVALEVHVDARGPTRPRSACQRSALRAAVALFTSTSTRPNASSACSTIAAGAVPGGRRRCRRPRCRRRPRSRPPRSRRRHRCDARCRSRAPTRLRAAKSRACSRPMPPPAPVTITALPSSRPLMCSPPLSCVPRRGASPASRRFAVRALEGAAERLLRFVADASGDRHDAEVGGVEQLLGEVHAPLGEVADRRPAEHLAEALVEHRPRHRGLGREVGDRPAPTRDRRAAARVPARAPGRATRRATRGRRRAPTRGDGAAPR